MVDFERFHLHMNEGPAAVMRFLKRIFQLFGANLRAVTVTEWSSVTFYATAEVQRVVHPSF